jgi:hypothetical protein
MAGLDLRGILLAYEGSGAPHAVSALAGPRPAPTPTLGSAAKTPVAQRLCHPVRRAA